LFSAGGCAKSCEIVSTFENDQWVEKVRMTGCEIKDEATENLTATTIDISSLTLSGGNAVGSLTSMSNIDGFSEAKNFSYGNGGFNMNFELYDSSYTNPSYLLGAKGSASFGSQSKLSKILSEISPRRKSVLTKTIIDANPGLTNTPGAVVILW